MFNPALLSYYFKKFILLCIYHIKCSLFTFWPFKICFLFKHVEDTLSQVSLLTRGWWLEKCSGVHFIFLISEASVDYLDMFWYRFSWFQHFQMKTLHSLKRHTLVLNKSKYKLVMSNWFTAGNKPSCSWHGYQRALQRQVGAACLHERWPCLKEDHALHIHGCTEKFPHPQDGASPAPSITQDFWERNNPKYPSAPIFRGLDWALGI